MTRLLLVGHGRMGRLIEALAPSYDCEIAGIVTRGSTLRSDGEFPPGIDVAIDFSLPDAVPANFPRLASHGIDVVIGTTGWQAHEAALRGIADRAGIGVLASANFSIGMSIFQLAVAHAAEAFGRQPDVGAWIQEAHHAAKKDAPSGTALMLKRAMEDAGYARAIDVSSVRAGSIPGTHTAGFDAAAETVTLTHTVRDRAVFARGALEAARWLKGKQGWFTMGDFVRGSQ